MLLHRRPSHWLPVFIAAFATATAAQDPIPSPADLEARQARIGTIIVQRVDIFDRSAKGENHFIAVAANALHVQTKEHVIRRELLFAEGDPYRQALVEESERNLRKLRFVYNIRIEAIDFHDGVVDLLVVAQDNWTTRLKVSANHLGGVTTSELEIKEINLAGFGKLLELSRKQDIDRTSYALGYDDPRLLGSRFQVRLFASNNSDGDSAGIDLRRPFFSLASRWYMRTIVENVTERNSIYEQGEVVADFRHQQERYEAFYGISPGLRGDTVDRLRFGFQYVHDRFDDLELDDGAIVELPEDRIRSAPMVEWERIVSRYVVRQNYESLDRDEDYNLGPTLRLRAGLSLEQLGSSTPAVPLEMQWQQGWELEPKGMLLLEASVTGDVASRAADNDVGRVQLRFYDQRFVRHTLYASVGLAAAYDVEPDHRLYLGGETGLRAYDARRFQGDSAVLLSLEDRYFRGWSLFRVLDVGLSAFVDIGNAWERGGAFGNLHADVGLGVRIGLRKAAHIGVVTFEIAYPLEVVDGKRALSFTVGQGDF